MFTLHSRVLVTVAVAGTAILLPSPASAHPFGDPQTVAITADARQPDVVHVKWRVGGPDDLTVLGVSLGLLPAGSIYHYTDPGLVGASPRFGSYLLGRITVTAAGQPCAGAVEPVLALALKGATVSYRCPAPVSTATVAVRMLTDLNPAYRTLATGPGGQRTVYDDEHASHDWSLTGTPGRGGVLVPLGAVLIGLLAVALLAFRWVKR